VKVKTFKPARIPMAVALAVATYYHNRNRQWESQWVNAGTSSGMFVLRSTGYKWDKDHDEQNVFNVARKCGFHNMYSCCGTFWLVRGKYTYEVNESSWPKATITRNKQCST
jgi:hypothetical protein